MVITSIKLVSLPGAPAYQEKVYLAHMDTGEDVWLFQAHWDVPLPPETLVGLTIEEAKRHRVERMLAVAGLH